MSWLRETALLRAAAEFLGAPAGKNERIKVRLTRASGARVTVEGCPCEGLSAADLNPGDGRPDPDEIPPDMRPTIRPGPDWLLCTPLEESVLKALDGGQQMTREQLAEKLTISPTGAIKGTLAAMVEKRWILSDQHHGYSLNRPATAPGV